MNPKPRREEVKKGETRLREGQSEEDWEATSTGSTEATQKQDNELVGFYNTQEVNLALDDIPEEGIEGSQLNNDETINAMKMAGDNQVETIQVSEIPYSIHVDIP